MLGNSIEFGSKFTHKAMQDLASFARTRNMATQAIAKANADIATTGTAHCVINGVHIASLTAETGRTLANDLQFTIWLTETAYTTAANDCRYVADANGNKQWYKCIADHTSAAGTKPGQETSGIEVWRTYWTESTNKCEPAVGTVSANGITRYFLALADNLGVTTTVIADDGYQLTAAQSLIIPHFDPEIWCAIGLYTLTGTGASTWGTTDDNAQVGETQFVGPIFPSDLTKDKFNYRPMQDICAYSKTENISTATQLKGSADLTQTTGVQPVVINNDVDESLAKTSTVAPDTDVVLTIWVTGSSYTAAASVNYIIDPNGRKQWYRCILDHTASADNMPGQTDHVNETWRTYWTESSNRAIQAGLDEVTLLSSRYYLILQRKTTGIVTSVIAGDVALDADVELSIPRFDPEIFVAIAIILLNSGTSPNIWGTTDDNGEVTITQIIGPCFPTNKGVTDTIQGNTASTIS